MSFSPDISSNNLDKLKNYPEFMHATINERFQRIADPAGDNGFLYVEDVKKANRYIEDLPPPAADLKNKDLHKHVTQLIKERKLQHHNPENKTTYTMRQMDHQYVMKQERHRYRRNREVEAITYKMVKLYASSRAERDTRYAMERNDKMLSKKSIQASNGSLIPLNEIVNKSNEFKTWETLHRLKVLSQIMENNNWQAMFSVVTLPSRFHPKSKKWDGSMPDIAHAWANKKWSVVRSTLGQMGYDEGLDYMAVRTVEAHKDGCPHYNFIFIGNINFLKNVNTILHEKYLLAKDADGKEKGATERRITTTIEAGKTACDKIVSYACKYALKTYLPEDMHKTDTHKKEHVRSVAWRQTWKIRAFSLAGFAPVTLWRECRSRHHSKNGLDIEKHAINTDWVEFQKEFIRIGKKNIKPIYIMSINRYKEEVKECVGHFIKKTNTIIAERISRAIIVLSKVITVRVSEPRKAEPRSKTDSQTVDPPPTDK